ncbi:MAG: hypothetical protein MUF24_13370, partial [Chitinophagaceae bacterium]|nr:hypothetical protein [Chitinophagaceae bacterium]
MWCAFGALTLCCKPGTALNRMKFAETAFYYWQTKFAPDSSVTAALNQLEARHLYVRLFDVDRDSETGEAVPV